MLDTLNLAIRKPYTIYSKTIPKYVSSTVHDPDNVQKLSIIFVV